VKIEKNYERSDAIPKTKFLYFIGLDVFMLSLTLAVLVAFLTVSFQSLKATLGNPANAIRHE
jgi:hypothetical protein